ncbi:UNVERIFIED_CONTAM: hypothetical protein NCL1_37907 [Trichonephila clavipes]
MDKTTSKLYVSKLLVQPLYKDLRYIQLTHKILKYQISIKYNFTYKYLKEIQCTIYSVNSRTQPRISAMKNMINKHKKGLLTFDPNF